MISPTTVQATADALACEAWDHGAPNSFSPLELWSRRDVPEPEVLVQIGRECPNQLNECAAKHSLRITYRDRRFHVEQQREGDRPDGTP